MSQFTFNMTTLDGAFIMSVSEGLGFSWAAAPNGIMGILKPGPPPPAPPTPPYSVSPTPPYSLQILRGYGSQKYL